MYRIKKEMNTYLGINSGILNRVVSGLTGLALLVNTSGCVDSINGIKIRAEDKTKIEVADPFAKKGEKKKEDETDCLLVGGFIVAGVTALGIGSYFLYEELTEKDRKKQPSSPYGGGENGGGPGGQWEN